jgi:hypothetical protein
MLLYPQGGGGRHWVKGFIRLRGAGRLGDKGFLPSRGGGQHDQEMMGGDYRLMGWEVACPWCESKDSSHLLLQGTNHHLLLLGGHLEAPLQRVSDLLLLGLHLRAACFQDGVKQGAHKGKG